MSIPTGSKVLVTGGTGFLGAYIIRELVKKGFQVRAIRRSQTLPFFIEPEICKKVEWVSGDILDTVGLEQNMEGVDALIHAAGKISFIASERKDMFRTNIEGTRNIVNMALDLGIKKLIYTSSVAALGRSPKGATLDEGKPWEAVKHQTHYGASKYHGEMEVWRAIGEGLDAIIVNPSTVIGYGDWNTGSCAMFKSVYNEFPWYTNGSNGFVDVEDIGRAVVMLLQTDISGERFLLSGENWTFRHLFEKIADGFSKNHPYREAGPILGAIAWRMEKIKSLFTGKPSILTRESARIAQHIRYYDHSKICQYLPGFQFTPLQDCIARSCNSYLRQLRPE